VNRACPPRGVRAHANTCRDTWAKTQSPNPNVKVYIGAAASQVAAGSGYVDVSTLANFATDAQQKYPSFGGVMLWDVSLAVGQCEFSLGARFECSEIRLCTANNDYHTAIKSCLVGSALPGPYPITQSQTLPTPTSTEPPTSTKPHKSKPIWTPNFL
jgi:chitinase